MGIEIKATIGGYLILINGESLSYKCTTLESALKEVKEIFEGYERDFKKQDDSMQIKPCHCGMHTDHVFTESCIPF
jgi:hypothetical protein